MRPESIAGLFRSVIACFRTLRLTAQKSAFFFFVQQKCQKLFAQMFNALQNMTNEAVYGLFVVFRESPLSPVSQDDI